MTDLVVMTKGGESAEVHRTCVKNHERLGWVVSPVPVAQPDHAAAARPKRAKPTDHAKE
jgi:hypothetical protein